MPDDPKSCTRCGDEYHGRTNLCRRCRAEPLRTIEDTMIRYRLRNLGFQIWQRSPEPLWRDHEGKLYSQVEAVRMATEFGELDFVIAAGAEAA